MNCSRPLDQAWTICPYCETEVPGRGARRAHAAGVARPSRSRAERSPPPYERDRSPPRRRRAGAGSRRRRRHPRPSAAAERRAAERRASASPAGRRPRPAPVGPFPRPRPPEQRMTMDRTLILVKPDAFARWLTRRDHRPLRAQGPAHRRPAHMTVTRELAEHHYAEHAERPFFGELVEFITSGPLVAMVLEGDEASSAARQVIGATNPLEAAPGSIRGDFAICRSARTWCTARTRRSRPRARRRCSSETSRSCPGRRRARWSSPPARPSGGRSCERLGVAFTVRVPDVAERAAAARRRSWRSRTRCARRVPCSGRAPRRRCSACDTWSSSTGAIYGKPADEVRGARRRCGARRAHARGGQRAGAAGGEERRAGRARARRSRFRRARRARCSTGTWPPGSGGGEPAATRSRVPGERVGAPARAATRRTSSACRWRRCSTSARSCWAAGPPEAARSMR